MAQITYRGNLAAKRFPLLSSLEARNVIVKGQDQNYVASLTPKSDSATDAGVPQVFYAENVMPTSEGFQSVGFRTFAAGNEAISSLSAEFELKDDAGHYGLLGFNSLTGDLYVMTPDSPSWVVRGGSSDLIGKTLSVAHVGGVSYIYASTHGCMKYDFTTNTFSDVTLTGLTASAILYIVAVAGYLLAFNSNYVAWSSTVDATDFTPSLATGAGGGGIENLGGTVIHVEPAYLGAIIFSSTNAVACTFSNNQRFPFNFSLITGAGGLVAPAYCARSTSANITYAYTKVGLQAVTLKQAKTVYPDITDFLSGEVIEYFNSNTNTFTQKNVIGVLKKGIAFIADRYLVLSYGETQFTHAIIIDTALEQYGKIALPHNACFEFQLFGQLEFDTPKKSVAFVGDGGKVSLLDFSFTSTHAAVIVLGKFQYVRARTLQLEGAEIGSVKAGWNCEVFTLPSLEGDDFNPAIAGFLSTKSGNGRKYLFHSTASNHSLLVKGTFDLTYFLLTFTIGGAW